MFIADFKKERGSIACRTKQSENYFFLFFFFTKRLKTKRLPPHRPSLIHILKARTHCCDETANAFRDTHGDFRKKVLNIIVWYDSYD